MLRGFRFAGLTLAFCACAAAHALAQAPPLVFTVATPDRGRSETTPQTFVAVEERGLALWGGTASDFGVGVSLAGPRWTVRTVTSMTSLPVGSQRRRTFQQVEVVRSVMS